jgi:hypothetical protein
LLDRTLAYERHLPTKPTSPFDFPPKGGSETMSGAFLEPVLFA